MPITLEDPFALAADALIRAPTPDTIAEPDATATPRLTTTVTPTPDTIADPDATATGAAIDDPMLVAVPVPDAAPVLDVIARDVL
jgi:hypothetical protein